MKTRPVSTSQFSIVIFVILVTMFAAAQPVFAKPPAPGSTRTPKPTRTSNASPTPTSTHTATATPTATATRTASPTPTAPFTFTPTFTPTATLPPAPVPHSMAALGDSITGAYDTGSWGYHREYSWSTGTDPTVNSLYLRLKAIDPSVSSPSNLAVSGAKMIDLNGQAASVNPSTEFVTILMGANDACTPSVDTMTSVEDFTAQFTAAMDTLYSRVPNAEIYVASIPDIYRLWELMHTNSTARFWWGLGSICPSMLANPTSTAQVDIDRRATVAAHNLALNNVLANVCSTYANCHFDNYAVYNTEFLAADVSTVDYFHPSITGQAKLAQITWDAARFLHP